jgi:uncharacterized protein YciI
MLYVVLFEDNPSLGTDVRRQHMPAHLSFLEKNAACIKAAGPLRTPSGDAAGGLWVVDADSAEGGPILADRIAAFRPHSELGAGLRRRQATHLTTLK